jgi:hypothetical protein
MMRSTLALVLVASLAGCKPDSPSSGSGFASPTAPAAVATGSGPAPTPAPIDPKPTPSGSGPVEKIFAQMAKEKQSRPGRKPTVEEVYAAIARAGVTFDESKQVVAMSAGARYCVTASNKAGLIVVVCEYESAADAERLAQMLIDKYQKLAPTRTFAIKGSTSIQVVDREDSPLPDARRRIDEALATL